MTSKTCVFCGAGGRLTGEHVFGDWLTRVGLSQEPSHHGAGPMNRSLRDLGVTLPFRRTVRDVCGRCNHGWMSHLEATASRVLTPLLTKGVGCIEASDLGLIAAWAQKTAIVSMLLSSDEDRARGYGVPPAEYRSLHDVRHQLVPSPNTQFWIGRYHGTQRLAATSVSPIIVTAVGREPDLPDGYVMTIVLGEVLIQGVRFTTPGTRLDLGTAQGFSHLWPAIEPIGWPDADPVDDEAFALLSKGLNLVSREPGATVQPWKPATDLPDGETDGARVRLLAPCGDHFVYYPAALVIEARQQSFYAFVTACECERAYLVKTEPDGAHFKAEAKPAGAEDLVAKYEELPGQELILQDAAGQFVCKRLPR